MATRALFPTFYDEDTKIWRGINRQTFYHPDCSAGAMVFNLLKNWPNHVIEINHSANRKLTAGEVRQWAVRLALFFQKENLSQDDVIGIIGKSSTYVGALAAACFFEAIPFHAVNKKRDAPVVKHLFGATKPKLMFCDGADYARIKEVTKDWSPKIITLTDPVEGVTSIEDLLQPSPEEQSYQPATLVHGGDQTAAILCSSGTSGLPKATAISHKYVAALNVMLNTTDVTLINSTIDWASSFACLIFSLKYGIPRLTTDGDFQAASFVGLIKEYKVTMILLAPWQAYELFTSAEATEENLKSLKLVAITGGWITSAVLQQAQSVVKDGVILFMYGTTEAAVVAGNIEPRLDNSVGRIFPGVRIKIVGDDGNNSGHNQIGDIYIDPGFNWQGYVSNAADTATTLKNGWIDLGDMGYFDSDNNLFMVDRKKDLLKYKSNHYWPNEIEQIIAEFPEVQHVCVIGAKDPRNGDSAGALVIKKPGAEITEKQIIDYVAKRVVVEHKQLNSGVQFVTEIPLGPNGKFNRRAAGEVFAVHMN